MLCTLYRSLSLYFRTGTKQRTRFIPLYTVAAKLGDEVLGLVGLLRFTGCDSTSAFVGKRKKTALELMRRYPKFAATMSQLGHEFHPSEELQDLCEELTCSLNGNVRE